MSSSNTVSFLTASAQKGLVESLERFGNKISVPHRKAIYTLVESFMKMAGGSLTGRWAFGIPTGCGKTRAIIECCAAIHHTGSPFSTVTCASRIEALCQMKRDMVACGVPASKIGLMYTAPKTVKYSEPNTSDNRTRQFLLISHQRIRANEKNLEQYNDYLGKPRQVLVYDESLLVSDIEHFPIQELVKALSGWNSQLKLDIHQHVDMCNWLASWEATIHHAYEHFNSDEANFLTQPTIQLSVDQQVDYQHMFRSAGDEMLAAFLAIGGLPMRLIRHNKIAAITYRVVIPAELENILVLDASYPIRQLEKVDQTLRNAEDLPSCKAFSIRFNEIKRFDQVTLHRMAHHGGRSSVATNKTRMKKILQDTAKIIHDIPEDEGVLVFVYKDRTNRNSAKALEVELRKVDLDLEDNLRLTTGEKRINIETWGNETSLNSYRYCKHVLLVGILHRDLTELEAQHLGQVNDISRKVDATDLKAISLSERAHLAYQALSRGSCRVMGSEGQASPMTGYIVEYDEGIEAEISKVMPGVVWKTWEPVYSDNVAHGRLILDLTARIDTNLKELTLETVTIRSLKKTIGKSAQSFTTWQKALRKALELNPQWNQQSQSLKRVA